MKIPSYTAILPLLFILSCSIANTAQAENKAKADDGVHRVVIQVNANDPTLMALALNNAANINKYYMDEGEEVEIEVVTFGPGLSMLIADTSPVKDRIANLAQNFDNISYKACANTIKGMAAKSGKDIELLEAAEIVPSGVIHIMHRQEEGWSYIKP
jgi:hypothetical protein